VNSLAIVAPLVLSFKEGSREEKFHFRHGGGGAAAALVEGVKKD
jgi:hypothetical protein